MATMVKLLFQRQNIVDETYRRIHEAEQARSVEYSSVVRIQSWYRAIRVRCYLKHLNHCALSIQRRWRGFLGRRDYRRHLQRALFDMKLRHFTQNAVKIQKTWRGFFTRKYVSNYYSRRRYLEAVDVKNDLVRRELDEYTELTTRQTHQQRETEEEVKLEKYLQHHHHLLSTTTIPGVYNSPYQPCPMLLEGRLRNTKVVVKKKRVKMVAIFDPNSVAYNLPKPTLLPPVLSKPQGPFRKPEDIQSCRYEPFRPTLRVMTDYFSLEKARMKYHDVEWLQRLSDNVFQPFTHRSVPYEPYLHPTSSYGDLPYGSKYFREEFPLKFVSQKDFKTIVPPVPIFEKLNKTCSTGQV